MRLALALLPLLATPALADAVTYRGTVGSRDVVIELTEPSDGPVVGRFAFMDEGKSVPLRSEANTDTSFLLSEEGLCTPDICTFADDGTVTGVPTVAEWQLTLDGSTLTGTRSGTGKSKEQAIAAEEIGRRSLSGEATTIALRENIYDSLFADVGPLDPAKVPYELAVADGPLVEDRRFVLGDAVVSMKIDPRTEFAFPHVLSFVTRADAAPIEAILGNEHAGLSISALDCLSSGYVGFGANEWSLDQASLGGYNEENVVLTYASPRLVSWYQAGSLFCGGAHPYNHIDSYTFDAQTGGLLDFSRIFLGWVPVDFEDNVVDLETARANPDEIIWQPDDALIAFVREHLPPELATDDPELDEACYSEDAIRGQLDFRFEEGPNVVFTGSGFPHVIGVCNGDLFSMPLAELGDLLTPEAMTYFAD
ncbi:hypothetical protein [Devosia rhizoryzae]|uniref:DUF3298 domain-containing protein n=1 Tax=Devosia rhizoryzae TaxID=2774137 RepID=A0ABX7C1R9_9HYPH|nr:hypothetical protein [Devosia rhizoryzae]QQR38180.1 hypothetical protein JI748_10305 [Devosia rhizoryzae]